jgi:hypothetical protein
MALTPNVKTWEASNLVFRVHEPRFVDSSRRATPDADEREAGVLRAPHAAGVRAQLLVRVIGGVQVGAHARGGGHTGKLVGGLGGRSLEPIPCGGRRVGG